MSAGIVIQIPMYNIDIGVTIFQIVEINRSELNYLGTYFRKLIKKQCLVSFSLFSFVYKIKTSQCIYDWGYNPIYANKLKSNYVGRRSHLSLPAQTLSASPSAPLASNSDPLQLTHWLCD